MSNRTRKQSMFVAAGVTVVVLINLWMSFRNASTSRLIQEDNEKAKRRLEQAINERSID